MYNFWISTLFATKLTTDIVEALLLRNIDISIYVYITIFKATDLPRKLDFLSHLVFFCGLRSYHFSHKEFILLQVCLYFALFSIFLSPSPSLFTFALCFNFLLLKPSWMCQSVGFGFKHNGPFFSSKPLPRK